MSEIKDDPREVLVLLNSLGFVGITAIQLKGFMKDLKIYRKVKDRERQQRKEEIKTKIITKQQALLTEGYGHRYSNTEEYSSIRPSESSTSLDAESVVKVRIRCRPKEEPVLQQQTHSKATAVKSDEKFKSRIKKYDKEDGVEAESDRIHCQHHFNTKSYSVVRGSRDESNQTKSKCLIKQSQMVESGEQNLQVEEEMKEPVTLVQQHPASAPVFASHTSRAESKSHMSDPCGMVRAQSALSARSSVTHKSFIRPWRLQSEAQKNITNKKCDPVALYQKYQQEWKQIAFPGEAKHSKVRWAIREKMLGTDPHPVPLSKKSVSCMPILKRK